MIFLVNYELVAQIQEKVKVDPQQRKQVFPLHTPDSASVQFTPWVDNEDELPDSGDTELTRLHSIVANNSFEFNGTGSMLESESPYYWSGLWILPSYINHSCSEANATWAVYGDVFFLRAVRPIAAGDEIQISYVNITWPYQHRCGVITDHKFVCGCNLCEFEKEESQGIVESREEILKKMRELYHSEEKVSFLVRYIINISIQMSAY